MRWYRPFLRFHELTAPMQEARRHLSPTEDGARAHERVQAVIAGANAGWDQNDPPIREFGLPQAEGAHTIVQAMLRAWQPVHRSLNRATDPATTPRATWEQGVALAVSELWLLQTAGRIHQLNELTVTFATQVLLDDLREAIARREVAEVVARTGRPANPELVGTAIAMIALGVIAGTRATATEGAERYAWATGVDDPQARDLAEQADPPTREMIARAESAWRRLWDVGLTEFRGLGAMPSTDPLGPLDPSLTRDPRQRMPKPPSIQTAGLFGAFGGWHDENPATALAEKLRQTAFGCQMLHQLVAHETQLTGRGAPVPLFDPRGANMVVDCLRLTEDSRRRSEEAMNRYGRALGSWHANLSRAKANPRWTPGQPVDLPGSLSRAELVAILIEEYLRAGVPLGITLETLVTRLADDGTLTNAGRLELQALTMMLAATTLARPAIESDPLGDAQQSMDDSDRMRRRELRRTLGAVEERIMETAYSPVATDPAAPARWLMRRLSDAVAMDVDRHLRLAAGIFPLAGSKDRAALGWAEDPARVKPTDPRRQRPDPPVTTYSYAERVLLRRLGINELWALHAHFAVRGDAMPAPMDACFASMAHVTRTKNRLTGEIGETMASTGESLAELTDRVRAACLLTAQAEPRGGGPGAPFRPDPPRPERGNDRGGPPRPGGNGRPFGR